MRETISKNDLCLCIALACCHELAVLLFEIFLFIEHVSINIFCL